MSTFSKNNGSCDNCCKDVKGNICILGDFGGKIEPNSEPVYNFTYDVEYSSGNVSKECKKAADDAIALAHKDELEQALKNQAKQWVNSCLSAQPAPCNQVYYTNPKTGKLERNPAYKNYPSSLMECIDFDDTICFNNCNGECNVSQ